VSQYGFGHAIRINQLNLGFLFRFQNFFIGDEVVHRGDTYGFAPFGFSGVTVNRTGDGLEATLVFPNNNLTRAWAINAVEDRNIIEVDVLLIEDSDRDTGPNATHNIVHSYVGQVTGGQWDNVSLNLELSSLLDAVGTDVPRRSLTRELVGNLPISNGVRLQ
jgi:hypothetical protein